MTLQPINNDLADKVNALIGRWLTTKSPSTARSYRLSLRHLDDFCAEALYCRPLAMRPEDAVAFCEWLADRMSASSVASHMKRLSAWYEGLRPDIEPWRLAMNPFQAAKKDAMVRKITKGGAVRRRCLSVEEVQRVWDGIDAAFETRKASDIYRLAFAMGAFLGRRSGVITSVTWRSVNRASRRMEFVGKGGKQHEIIIYEEVWPVFESHLTKYDPVETERVVPLSASGLRKQCYRVAAHVGLPSFPMHALRRTFATEAFGEGADAAVVQAWLNHSDMKTTQLYNRRSQSINEELAPRRLARSILNKEGVLI